MPTIKTLLRLTGRENLGSEWRMEFKEDLTEGTNPVSSLAHNTSLRVEFFLKISTYLI